MPEIDNYIINMYGGPIGTANMNDDKDHFVRTLIRVLDSDNREFGLLYFYDSIPNYEDYTDYIGTDGLLYMYLPLSLLPIVIDFLYNYKPISLDFDKNDFRCKLSVVHKL